MSARSASLLALAGELRDRDDPTEEVLGQLRRAGASLSESIEALAKTGRMSADAARAVVVGSTTWADVGEREAPRELVEWVEPVSKHASLDFEQLHAICSTEPQLAEAWLGRRRVSRADNPRQFRHESRLDFVFDEGADRSHHEDKTPDLSAKIIKALPNVDIRVWVTTHGHVPNDMRLHGLRVYHRRNTRSAS